jgi:hypothetical protein
VEIKVGGGELFLPVGISAKIVIFACSNFFGKMRLTIKKYRGSWIGALLCWCVVWLAGAQHSAPQATFKATSHNFGKIQEVDGPVSHVFEFTNTSRTPMLIEFISVSCGCTTPEYSREPILPGKSGRIKVTYDPTGRPGAFNSSVVVTSNERRDQVSLTIQGEVIPRPRTIEDQFPVALTDNGLRAASNNLIFGYLGHGKKKSQTLDIYNGGSAPIRLGYRFTEATKIPEGIARVEITPALLQPKGRGQVTFTYDLTGAAVYGLQAAAFVLTIDGRTASRPVSAYMTATDDFSRWTEREIGDAPEAVFSSQFYHFGTLRQNQSVEREFTIRNNGRSPLVVRQVTPNSPAVSYTLPRRTIAPGESVVLTVTLKTPPRSGRLSESLSIVVNDPARPMREVRIGANVE